MVRRVIEPGLSKPSQTIPTMHANDAIKKDTGLMTVLMFSYCARTSSLNHLPHPPDLIWTVTMYDRRAGSVGLTTAISVREPWVDITES